MSMNIKTATVMERFSADSTNTDDAKYLIPVNILLRESGLRLLLDVIIPIADCCLAMTIGAVIGWLGGWWMGSVYADHFKPVYFSDLNEVMRWYLMPSTFAKNGIFFGAVAGVIVMAALAIKQNVSNKQRAKKGGHKNAIK